MGETRAVELRAATHRSRAGGDGSGTGRVAVMVHGAREAVRGAEIACALPVGDHWALSRQDDLSRSRGSRGGEDLGFIPVPPEPAGAACLCGRALPVGMWTWMWTKRPPAAFTDSKKYLSKRAASSVVSSEARRGLGPSCLRLESVAHSRRHLRHQRAAARAKDSDHCRVPVRSA